MENDSNAAEMTIVAIRKKTAIAAIPVSISGHDGGVGNRYHQIAIGAASSAAAANEIASSARGVSMTIVGRNFKISAIATSKRNEIAKPVTP
jgi:hypothetical protein